MRCLKKISGVVENCNGIGCHGNSTAAAGTLLYGINYQVLMHKHLDQMALILLDACERFVSLYACRVLCTTDRVPQKKCHFIFQHNFNMFGDIFILFTAFCSENDFPIQRSSINCATGCVRG